MKSPRYDQAEATRKQELEGAWPISAAGVSEDLADHEAAANPHPVYLTQTEADALYDPLGSGAVAFDAIWDAKGDLAVGAGANAAARLAAGIDGYVLSADSAEATGLKWIAAPAGTGTGNSYFPGGWG